MKVYLAAPYSQKEHIKKCAEELRALGIEVTSSWLEETCAPTVQMHEITPETHREYAQRDLDDIRASDVMVFFTDPTKTIIRAGRHVEFGIAIGIGISRGMPIFVVGEEYENIFHYIRQVWVHGSWVEVKSYLAVSQSICKEIDLLRMT